jgi:hypothetical protein
MAGARPTLTPGKMFSYVPVPYMSGFVAIHPRKQIQESSRLGHLDLARPRPTAESLQVCNKHVCWRDRARPTEQSGSGVISALEPLQHRMATGLAQATNGLGSIFYVLTFW